jgi:hypothetical protein
MAQISDNSLMVTIQVLDEKIWSMKNQVDEADENDNGLADLEEELLSYTLVAQELRDRYEDALENTGNLPPYLELVRKE